MALAGGTGIGPATGPPYPDTGRCARPDHLSARTSIAVANHPSWIDPLVLASVMPQSFHFVAAEVLEHQGLNGLVLRRLATSSSNATSANMVRLTPTGWLPWCEAGGRSSSSPKADWRVPPGCGLSTWAHSWWPPEPAYPLVRRHSRDADNIVARAPFPTTRSHRRSPLVSRSGLQAPTGLRRLNFSMPRGTPFCAPLRLFAAYRLAGASYNAAEELDPPRD